MKILVTGGGGYIGSALSLELAKRGHEVTIIDVFIHKYASSELLLKCGIFFSNMKLIADYSPLLILKDYDVIFHLAAIAGSKACDEAGTDLTWDHNVKYTKRLIDCLSGDELLIFTSTSAIYGEQSRYTLSKKDAEKEVLKYDNSITVRLPTIFGLGPCMRENILIHDLVKSAVHDGHIVLWDRDSMRTWMYLDDCVSGLVSLMNNPSRFRSDIQNINGNFFSKGTMAIRIQKITDCEVFYSCKKEKYTQNFLNVPFPKFNYDEEIFSKLKELVTYYEGTKHSSAIDWSK